MDQRFIGFGKGQRFIGFGNTRVILKLLLITMKPCPPEGGNSLKRRLFHCFCNGGGKKCQKWVGFIGTQLLNELSLTVPVTQVLKEIEIFSNPEQPGRSSSIRSIITNPTHLCQFFSPLQQFIRKYKSPSVRDGLKSMSTATFVGKVCHIAEKLSND